MECVTAPLSYTLSLPPSCATGVPRSPAACHGTGCEVARRTLSQSQPLSQSQSQGQSQELSSLWNKDWGELLRGCQPVTGASDASSTTNRLAASFFDEPSTEASLQDLVHRERSASIGFSGKDQRQLKFPPPAQNVAAAQDSVKEDILEEQGVAHVIGHTDAESEDSADFVEDVDFRGDAQPRKSADFQSSSISSSRLSFPASYSSPSSSYSSSSFPLFSFRSPISTLSSPTETSPKAALAETNPCPPPGTQSASSKGGFAWGGGCLASSAWCYQTPATSSTASEYSSSEEEASNDDSAGGSPRDAVISGCDVDQNKKLVTRPSRALVKRALFREEGVATSQPQPKSQPVPQSQPQPQSQPLPPSQPLLQSHTQSLSDSQPQPSTLSLSQSPPLSVSLSSPLSPSLVKVTNCAEAGTPHTPGIFSLLARFSSERGGDTATSQLAKQDTCDVSTAGVQDMERKSSEAIEDTAPVAYHMSWVSPTAWTRGSASEAGSTVNRSQQKSTEANGSEGKSTVSGGGGTVPVAQHSSWSLTTSWSRSTLAGSQTEDHSRDQSRRTEDQSADESTETAAAASTAQVAYHQSLVSTLPGANASPGGFFRQQKPTTSEQAVNITVEFGRRSSWVSPTEWGRSADVSAGWGTVPASPSWEASPGYRPSWERSMRWGSRWFKGGTSPYHHIETIDVNAGFLGKGT